MAKRILCYTENYLPGGGNRYFVDVINCLDIGDVFLYSNKNGLFSQDFQQIKKPYKYKALNIWSVEALKRALKYEQKSVGAQYLMKVVIKLFRIIIAAACLYHNRRLFRKELKKIKPDLVMCFNGGYPAAYSCLDMMLESARNGTRSYLFIVSMPTARTLFEPIFYRNIRDAIDIVIVNSERIKDALARSRKFKDADIKVIYNSVSRANRAGNPDKFLRSIDFGKNNISTTVGYFGRIEEQKGVFYLVKAFSMLVNKRKDARLVMVGMGADTEKLRNYINELSMQGRIILAGYYGGEISDVLLSFDLFVFPSLWEGLPYSILEAMSAGKIIITTNVGGIPEAIKDRQEGLLVPPSDAGALEAKMDDVLSDIERYRALGRNAREKADKVFSFNRFTSDIKEIVLITDK